MPGYTTKDDAGTDGDDTFLSPVADFLESHEKGLESVEGLGLLHVESV